MERKNGWQLAEAAGDRRPDGMQDFLCRMRWDADAVRDDLRAYVVERLGDPGRGAGAGRDRVREEGRDSRPACSGSTPAPRAASRTLMFVVNTFGREATTSAAAATERKG